MISSQLPPREVLVKISYEPGGICTIVSAALGGVKTILGGPDPVAPNPT